MKEKYKLWKPEEDEILLKLRDEGISYEDIGLILGRTPQGCFGRIERMNDTMSVKSDQPRALKRKGPYLQPNYADETTKWVKG